MRKLIFIFFACTLTKQITLANNYEDAWKAIHVKNYKEAESYLKKAIEEPTTSFDAYCTLVYLQTYQGREEKVEGFLEALESNPDKNSYLYTLWFNGAVLNQYSKKLPFQQALLTLIEKDDSFNGSIKAAAKYVQGMHYFFSNKYETARKEWEQMPTIREWQFAGPFENISGSGFNTNYGPLQHADSLTKFKGMNDIEVNWFTPNSKNDEGWIYVYPSMQQSTAIVYGQSFVYSPFDTTVILNSGGNGSLKVWLNDKLLISESRERVTELDYYKRICKLKKGYNRILVQVGFTDNSIPNYIIRFTDKELKTVYGLTSTSLIKEYIKDDIASQPNIVKHFAELFFENKIKSEPKNLINYILLSQTYLRNSRTTESRQVIEQALKLAPDDPLLRFELMQTLIKTGNRTGLSEQVSWLKENDPESFINYQIKVKTAISEEKYTEANTYVDEMINKFGEQEYTLQLKAEILGKLDKVDDLVKLINAGYKQHPENTDFVLMMYKVKMLIQKDNKGAFKVFDTYFKNNFNATLFQTMATEYKEGGQEVEYLNTLKKQIEIAPQDPLFANRMSNYYFEKQDFKDAIVYSNRVLSLAPYDGVYWHNLAKIYEESKKDKEAIESYKKAIYYKRTDYDARKALTLLLKKQEPYKLLPENDVNSIVKNSNKDEGFNYTYLFDEKGAVIYDEGASEEFIDYAIKINTEKGIDQWKEINLNSVSSQTLIVEKCEVIKPNGSKIDAERNDGAVVFTGLQAGDAIHVKYKIQNYSAGRLGRAFWDKYTFNSFVNCKKSRYTLVVPKGFSFDYKVVNGKLTPKIKEVEDYKIYTWEQTDMPALESEPMMPPGDDVTTVLHISTVKNWTDIASWYSDIAYQNTSDNYELDALYQEIFKNRIKENDYEKTKRIYNYIVSNIRYSSVSFRQSGYVPQNISKIINTKLGDCKDVSSLFVALTNKAGIKSHLVLIDTRENGTKGMQLPSMEFNHCISVVKLNGKDYYIELTDSNLPFGTLPSNLNGALSLEIPGQEEKVTSELVPLYSTTRKPDKSIKNISVALNGNDVKLSVKSSMYGAIISGWRNEYSSLSTTKQKETFEQNISKSSKNAVKLDDVSFNGLSGTSDSLVIKSHYTIKNEVVEASSMKMIKVPFIDVIASVESLSADNRIYPIEYWNYENTDIYETYVEIQTPAGKKLLEYPADKTLTFKKSFYSLKFIKSGDKLSVLRKVTIDRSDIPAIDYQAFKKFFNDIVDSESKFIVFK